MNLVANPMIYKILLPLLEIPSSLKISAKGNKSTLVLDLYALFNGLVVIVL